MIFHNQPVTVDRIKEAYEKIGFIPQQENWINVESEMCCGLSAMVLADGMFSPEEWAEQITGSVARIAKALDLREHAILAFTTGFDGEPLEYMFPDEAINSDGELRDPELQEAYRLGQQAQKELF